MPLALTEDASTKQLMKLVKDFENDIMCLSMCEQTVFLPEPIFFYWENGTEKTIPICIKCIMRLLNQNYAIKYVIDPITHMIDTQKLEKVQNNLDVFLPYKSLEDKMWSIPIGQATWALIKK